jgi:hypothetical protein
LNLLRLLKLVVVAVIAGVAYLSGVFSAIVFDMADPTVRVELRNQTGKPIQSVEIAHGCGDRQTRLVEAPRSGAAVLDYGFLVCGISDGDSTYRVHVTHTDGSSATSQAVRVEPGDRMVATIGGTEIRTTSRSGSRTTPASGSVVQPNTAR